MYMKLLSSESFPAQNAANIIQRPGSARTGMAIAQTVAEIWIFFDFSRWRPPPSWIFKM